MTIPWKPTDMPTLTPALPGGRKLIEFVGHVFDAHAARVYPTPDGGVAHAEIRFGDSLVMTGDPMGEHTIPPGAAHVYVPDCDAAYQKALAHGATSKEPPKDQFYGDRVARVVDAQGNQWSIATHKEDVSEEELKRRMEAMMKGGG
jgi:PhnB protein